MSKYAHLYGTDIKWSGLLAETVRTVLPLAAAYQQPELSRTDLREVVIPKMAERVERGIALHRDGAALPNLQDVWGLAHDLQALAALVQWADRDGDPSERVKWH